MLIADFPYRRSSLPSEAMGDFPPQQYREAVPALLSVLPSGSVAILNAAAMRVVDSSGSLIVFQPVAGSVLEREANLYVSPKTLRNNSWSLV